MLPQDSVLRLDATAIDYIIIALYFVFVLGIGYLAKRAVSNSLDFFLSGRSLPAWVTGLAFISANLGAIEIMGMSANGAQYGMPTVHYFWIGAIPAMLFLGVVMMPFYYGSKVRSVPEFMLRRFGKPAHLVNAISFAVAQVLIAGVNLFLLATIVNVLLGWPIWVSVIVAAVDRAQLHHARRSVRGDLQRGAAVLRDRRRAAAADASSACTRSAAGRAWSTRSPRRTGGAEQLSAWPGNELSGFTSSFLSVIGLVFGLGFVLSFGYWTTNFVEVQRAMASQEHVGGPADPDHRRVPEDVHPVHRDHPGHDRRGRRTGTAGSSRPAPAGWSVTYNDALLLLMRDLLPNGMLGLAITGLLASFMAGMAANLSSFNTVMTYDLIERYVIKDRSDDFYLRTGRWVTVGGTVIAIGTAAIASGYSNLMDYLQQLFSFFNAPLFATFILGMFWKRMTATAGWIGLVSGTATAITGVHPVRDRRDQPARVRAPASSAPVRRSWSTSWSASLVSMVTTPKPDEELRTGGLVYSLTPKERPDRGGQEGDHGWYRKPTLLAGHLAGAS